MNTKKGSVSRWCKVSNCRNLKSASVKLYSLPKEGVRRDLWLERMNYIIHANLKNIYVCSDHFVTGKPIGEFHKKHVDWAPSINVGSNKTKQFLDGDHQVRNNVAFDKADTPPLIDVETATEDTSNNIDEDVALIEDTLLISDSHPIPSLNDVTTSTETFDALPALNNSSQSIRDVEFTSGDSSLTTSVDQVTELMLQLTEKKNYFLLKKNSCTLMKLSELQGNLITSRDRIAILSRVCCALYNSCSSVVPLL
ncbi:uncharacterized protein LOC124196207 isoform X2 [Daphnia pulex]|uniref:uncharacterized protein LOC124196207 isoform X2 n=1 Tax=Daphnia pulex TaxID=6669 RepID=UPI001EE027EC|nr:uncharacterized protein LOC124196207 isoform X2 [Daphnia pulex]